MCSSPHQTRLDLGIVFHGSVPVEMIRGKIEQDRFLPLIDQLVGNPGDFFTALIVDVTFGVDHRQVTLLLLDLQF